jgi:hypothetical protein
MQGNREGQLAGKERFGKFCSSFCEHKNSDAAPRVSGGAPLLVAKSGIRGEINVTQEAFARSVLKIAAKHPAIVREAAAS